MTYKTACTLCCEGVVDKWKASHSQTRAYFKYDVLLASLN